MLTGAIVAASGPLRNVRQISGRVAMGRALWPELVLGFAPQVADLRLEQTGARGVAVHGDADRLTQVTVNLLSNAIKFAPRGSTVEVRVEQRAGARVSVIDRGPGIPAEHCDKLFERFQQLDASDARAKGGTGLGLALACDVVYAADDARVGSPFARIGAVLDSGAHHGTLYLAMKWIDGEPLSRLSAAQP